jgi:ribosomal protein S18 acetylase RimI-like enzyme
MAPEVTIRTAGRRDLDDLVRLEQERFPVDAFDRATLERLLAGHTTVLVAEAGGRFAGSAVMLWRRGSRVGRLYSIAVSERSQGLGIGRRLLEACEREARRHDCTRISLEVRAANERAVDLYVRNGYRVTEDLPGYYEDGADGVRMVKELEPLPGERFLVPVPYYEQTTEFSCGPAALMMVLKYFRPELVLTRELELMLWKEATLIYTMSGHGGSGPYGLAVAAAQRGLDVHVRLSHRRVPFVHSVRDTDKQEIIRLVHRQMQRDADSIGVQTTFGNFTFRHIAAELRDGAIPIVLVSTWRRHKVRSPHWVVVTGYDRFNVVFHDHYAGFSWRRREGRDVVLSLKEFEKMRRHTRDVRKAAVFIRNRPTAVHD